MSLKITWVVLLSWAELSRAHSCLWSQWQASIALILGSLTCVETWIRQLGWLSSAPHTCVSLILHWDDILFSCLAGRVGRKVRRERKKSGRDHNRRKGREGMERKRERNRVGRGKKRESGHVHKTSWALGSELKQRYFCHILLARAIHKTSLVSRGREQTSLLHRESLEVTLQRMWK